MLARVCQTYLNNLNNFIISSPTTGLAKILRKKYESSQCNSVVFWQELEDYVKPGFLSDKNDREELDEMIMIFNHYKKELVKIMKLQDHNCDWVNWYCGLPSEKIKVVDDWFESKL